MEDVSIGNYRITFEAAANATADVPLRSYTTKQLDDFRRIQPYTAADTAVRITSLDNRTGTSGSVLLYGIESDAAHFLLLEQYIAGPDFLLVWQDGTILCLAPDTLDIRWRCEDVELLIRVEAYDNDFLAYGELALARISPQGTLRWIFQPNDHFVSYIGTENFVLEDQWIRMVDSNEVQYRIGYDGTDIDNINARYWKELIVLEPEQPAEALAPIGPDPTHPIPMNTIEIRTAKTKVYLAMAFILFVSLFCLYGLFYADNAGDISTTQRAITLLFMGIGIPAILVPMYRSTRLSEPYITLSPDGFTFLKNRSPVTYRWEEIIWWEIKTDDSNEYLILEVPGGEEKVQTNLLDRTGQEIYDLILQFKHPSSVAE